MPFLWGRRGICGQALAPADDGPSARPYRAACNRFYYRNPVCAAWRFVRRNANKPRLTDLP